MHLEFTCFVTSDLQVLHSKRVGGLGQQRHTEVSKEGNGHLILLSFHSVGMKAGLCCGQLHHYQRTRSLFWFAGRCLRLCLGDGSVFECSAAPSSLKQKVIVHFCWK